jgi:hypothetical protein
MIVFLVFILASFVSSKATIDEAHPRAVPTFHCIGVYWNPSGGGADNRCSVRYRPTGSPDWLEGMPLWFDGRGPDEELFLGDGVTLPAEYCGQYRGSIVNLTPGTEYEVELSLERGGARASLKVRTWDEAFPVAEKVVVPDRGETLVVDKSGSPGGYVLYTHSDADSTATIDVGGSSTLCIKIRASYVIIRALTLKNARQSAILIFEGCHDVVIEDCDISGWGRIADDGWGLNLDSAVYSDAADLERVVIQRNRIHHPRGDSNSWRELRPREGKIEPGHPEGPLAVCFRNTEGNHVIRYNTVFSDDDHRYNDILGGTSNFSLRGFPNRDSDIYGNMLSQCWDDAIESEGANCNVRIWGNYTTDCYVSIATAGTSVGPLYVWRNISGEMRLAQGEWDGGFLKTSNKMGGGRVFVFHNTILQPTRVVEGREIEVGARVGLGWSSRMSNVVSRNNILHARQLAILDGSQDPLGDYDYDLYTGRIVAAPGQEANGIEARPVYAGGWSLLGGRGRFWLSPNSPGLDAGVRLPNFNDGFAGAGPDVGAHESGAAPLRFGAAGAPGAR